MEDVLRWSLLVAGSCLIVGILVHGIWVSRKNNEKKVSTKDKYSSEQEFQPGGWQTDEEQEELVADSDMLADEALEINFDLGKSDPVIDAENDTKNETAPGQFDDLGLGAVRVVSKGTDKNSEATSSKEEKSNDTSENKPEPVASTSKIYASVVTQPKPEYAAKYQSLAEETVAISQQEKSEPIESQQSSDAPIAKSNAVKAQPEASPPSVSHSTDGYEAPEPPPFLLKKSQDEQPVDAKPKPSTKLGETADSGVDSAKAKTAEKPSLAEQARNLVKRKKPEGNRKRREPKIAEDQMRIDFDDEPKSTEARSDIKAAKDVKTVPKQEQPQEVLVLNVKVPEDTPIPGSALLPMLLTLGFKFGDQDIFHRHVNSNGKGPVLFSLANMFKPGNFDIDNLENFTTQGISLFMILPIEGDPHQVFNMMHNAARKIADEFAAQVYDGKRALLTKQSLQQYVEKIREFERQRMLNS